MQRGESRLDTVVGRCIAQRRSHSHQLEGRDGGGGPQWVSEDAPHFDSATFRSFVTYLRWDGPHSYVYLPEGLSGAAVSHGIWGGDNGPKGSWAVEKEDDIVLVFEKSWKSCHGCGMSCNGAGHDFTCCLKLT